MDNEFDEEHELFMVGGIGSATTLMEYSARRKKKVWKRAIGFNTDIDRLEIAD